MPAPIQHHLAGGIHPAAFVGATPPVLSDEQDHVLWIDTSTGPPYQLNMWDQASATWRAVGNVTGTGTGSAVDSAGDIHTACLVFLSHGASICNDVNGQLHLGTPTSIHQLDATGYELPSAHRLDAIGTSSQLPTPAFAPTLSSDTPVQSPPAAQLCTQLIAGLIYEDGYGGTTLLGPTATIVPPGGAGRVTIAAASIPLYVKRVIVYATNIQTNVFGTNNTEYMWPIDITTPGSMPAIELYASDMTDISGEIWNTSSLPTTNTSHTTIGSSGIPDPPSAPPGLSLSGLSTFFNDRFYKVRVAYAYYTTTTPLPGRDHLTVLGPYGEATSVSQDDIIHVGAITGIPPSVTRLYFFVAGYRDGTNLGSLYVYWVPVSGGATAPFSFSTQDSATQEGTWDDQHWPDPSDTWFLNTSGSILRLVDSTGLIDVEHDGTQCQIKSGGATVLETPFADLSGAPDVLVGKDPTTNLPAYCPHPIVVSQVVNNYNTQLSQPNPDPTVTCVQIRCGAAFALVEELLNWYGQVINWLKAILTWLGDAIATYIVNELASAVDAATEGAGLVLTPLEAALLAMIYKNLPNVSGPILQSLISSSLSPTALDDLQHSAFCAVQCNANQVALTQPQLQAWQSAVVGLPSSDFSTVQQTVIAGILQWAASFPDAIAEWAKAAQTGVANPSTSCDTWTCP